MFVAFSDGARWACVDVGFTPDAISFVAFSDQTPLQTDRTGLAAIAKPLPFYA